MLEDVAIAERKRADAIAQEYRAKGYEVSREVELDFFPNFRADIVARKGGEVTVVEVKTRTSLWQNTVIDELEKTLFSMPGWTFRLNLVDEREKLQAPEGARAYTSADVQRKLEEAENLLKSGFAEASLIVAWAAAEAVIRMLISEYGIETKRVTNSAYIIGLAVSEGVNIARGLRLPDGCDEAQKRSRSRVQRRRHRQGIHCKPAESDSAAFARTNHAADCVAGAAHGNRSASSLRHSRAMGYTTRYYTINRHPKNKGEVPT